MVRGIKTHTGIHHMIPTEIFASYNSNSLPSTTFFCSSTGLPPPRELEGFNQHFQATVHNSSRQDCWLPSATAPNFGNAGNRVRVCWVRSKFTTSVLCSPLPQLSLVVPEGWKHKGIPGSEPNLRDTSATFFGLRRTISFTLDGQANVVQKPREVPRITSDPCLLSIHSFHEHLYRKPKTFWGGCLLNDLI